VRVGSLPKATALDAPPLWPPLLATRGPGALSAGHAHHAMHLVLAADGELRVRSDGETRWRRGAGVLTAPDVKHEIDGRGVDVLLVFIDPESDVGEAFLPLLSERPIRVVDAKARDALVAGADPMTIMRAGGVEWTRRAVDVLGGTMPRARRPVHPRVRRLIALLRTLPPDGDETSLEALAARVGLSPSRLMHAFTESIGVPLRPYLAWLRLQRAAAAIVSGAALADAAHAAGFADAAHMTRTMKRMLGLAPSELRARTP
jgi:AraC-like DNA-binding protein